MPLTLNFTFGTPCASGGHIPVTATLAGDITANWTTTVRREVLVDAPTHDDRQAVTEVLLRLLVQQIAPKTPGNIKSKVEGTTINLTVSA